jgi:hypothetical protein
MTPERISPRVASRAAPMIGALVSAVSNDLGGRGRAS